MIRQWYSKALLSLLVVITIILSTAIPVFAISLLVGRTDVASDGNGAVNQIFMTKFTASSSGTGSEVHIRVTGGQSGNIIVGIWSDSGGEPNALLATTASTAITNGVERSVTIALTSNVTITSGTVYWIGSNQQTGNLNGLLNETSVNRYKSLSYGALPDPAGSGYSSYTLSDFVAGVYGDALSTPVVTTNAASSVASTSATLNGNITATSPNATYRGFEWGTTSNTTLPASTQSPRTTPYSTNYTESGNYNAGTFNYSAGSLSTGTTYYFRAYAYNTNGWGYGSEQSFLTIPAAPTNVAASTTNASAVRITWTKSTGATAYYVYRDSAEIASLGDVAIHNDGTAAAPTITAGTGSATDGVDNGYVTLSVAGASGNNGTSYQYKVRCSNATGNSTFSSEATGYRAASALSYQWYRSAGDSDATYSVLAGATTNPYNDTTGAVDPNGYWYYAYETSPSITAANSTHNRGYMSAAPSPLVSTLPCTGFTSSSGIVNGQLTSLNGGGAITSYGFDYGLTTAYGSEKLIGTTLTVGSKYWTSITGLTAGTVYHFRAKAYNGVVWGYGTDMIFSTKGSPVVYEYLNTGGDGDSEPIYQSNTTYQQFTVGNISHSITHFIIPLKKTGTPTGTLTVGLYHADGSFKPTGTVIVSDTMDVSSLSAGYVWFQFDVTETQGEANQLYAIRVSLAGGDSSNYVLWQSDAGGGLAGAISGYSVDGGITWSVAATEDCLFEVWGNAALQVLDAKIFQNYSTNGDWLVCAEVQNTYAPYYPNTDPQLSFRLQLINGSTVVADTALHEFGRRPIAILISPATAGTLTWGSANIKIRVQLNGVVGSYAEYAMTATDWQSGGNIYVDNWVRYIVSDIQTYDISTGLLASTGTYTVQSNIGKLLNASGGQIFITGIPLIQSIRPNLFQYTSTSIKPTPSTAVDTWTGAASHDWTTNIGATNAASMTAIANSLGIPSGKDLIAFFFYAIWLVGGALLLGKGHSTSALAVGLPIMALAAYSGFVDIQPLAIAACLAAFVFVKAIFFDRAG